MADIAAVTSITNDFPVVKTDCVIGEQHLPVLLIDMPGFSSVTVLLLANTGSRNETQSQEGLAHFFEHMVFKGTKNYPTAKILSETLDSFGSIFNAFTGKEYTGYYVKTASQYFETALNVLSDMLLLPNLKQEDIDRESGVIIEELNMYADMPASHVASLFEELVYKERGLAHDIIGRKETIKSFQTQHFQSFLQKYYGLENLQLVIAGGLEKIPAVKKTAGTYPSLLKLITEKFSKLSQPRQAGKLVHPQAQTGITYPAFSSKKFLLQWKKTEQAHFVMAWPGLDNHHKDRYVEAVLATILGGPMSSRLFTEVREKRGLAYYVHADDDMYHDSGVLSCNAGVDPQRVEEAIKVTKAVFEDLASGKQKVTTKELTLAKNYLKGKLLLGLEESSSVATFFGFRQLLSNEIVTPSQLAAQFEAVTLEQVQQLATQIIQPDQLRFAMIAHRKDEERVQSWIK